MAAVKRKTAKKKRQKKRKKARSSTTKSSALSAEVALRHEDWVQKRIAGWSPREISQWADVHYNTVRLAIANRIAVAGLPEARELLQLNLERLDAILKKLWPAAFGTVDIPVKKKKTAKKKTKGKLVKQWVDLDVIDRILKVTQQISRQLQPVLGDIVNTDNGISSFFDMMTSPEFVAYIKNRDNGAVAGVVDVKAIVRPGGNGKDGGNGL